MAQGVASKRVDKHREQTALDRHNASIRLKTDAFGTQSGSFVARTQRRNLAVSIWDRSVVALEVQASVSGYMRAW